jgi:dihydropteroate synthase/2-amino-4-hydroxy-6-hydroxymethyldihydropteridine diphosphokinase
MFKAFLSLGSNLGNTSQNIEDAYGLLSPKCTILNKSTTILTKPYGITDQPDFANSAIKVETELEPLELLEFIKSIEAELGRVENKRWRERLIDIDIIFYDDMVVDIPNIDKELIVSKDPMKHNLLTIPHKDYHNRTFVVEPLLEIEPGIVDPKTGVKLIQNYRILVNCYDSIVESKGAWIMGILNVTPDSFSDGGKNSSLDIIIENYKQMIIDGADIVDIGGESTRPKAVAVGLQEEIDRVIPVIQAIRSFDPKTVLSIDTYKPEIAELALQNGVDIVNDITGLTNPKMVDVITKYNCPIVIMHKKGDPATMQDSPYYDDVVQEVYDFFVQQIGVCKAAGIEKIILDVGIGFGKRLKDNLDLIKNLDKFVELGYPVLFGSSRKGMYRELFGLDVDNREEVTMATTAFVIQKKAKIIRVHNVLGNKRIASMIEILQKQKN